MDRRGFFKVVGTATAALALPVLGATKLLPFDTPTPANVSDLGLIREVFAYEVATDYIYVRYDVLTKDEQLGVDMRFLGKEECNARLPEYRELAKEMLEREMHKRGKSWASLRPMPIPHGYERPDWVTV